MKKNIKQTFDINGKIYHRFEDIPEKDRQRLDKNHNGIIDFVENNRSKHQDLYTKLKTFKAKEEKKKALHENSDHFVRNRIIIIVFVGLILLFGYLFF